MRLKRKPMQLLRTLKKAGVVAAVRNLKIQIRLMYKSKNRLKNQMSYSTSNSAALKLKREQQTLKATAKSQVTNRQKNNNRNKMTKSVKVEKWAKLKTRMV